MRGQNDDKNPHSLCGAAVPITPAAMVRKREASGYSEFMLRKIRISGRLSLRISRKDTAGGNGD